MGGYWSDLSSSLGVPLFDKNRLKESRAKNFNLVLSTTQEERLNIIKDVIGDNTYDSYLLIGSKNLKSLFSSQSADHELRYWSKVPEDFKGILRECWKQKSKKFLVILDDCLSSGKIPGPILEYLITGGNLNSRVILTSGEPVEFAGDWYLRNVSRVIIGTVKYPEDSLPERIQVIKKYLERNAKIDDEKFLGIFKAVQANGYKLVLDPYPDNGEKSLTMYL